MSLNLQCFQFHPDRLMLPLRSTCPVALFDCRMVNFAASHVVTRSLAILNIFFSLFLFFSHYHFFFNDRESEKWVIMWWWTMMMVCWTGHRKRENLTNDSFFFQIFILKIKKTSILKSLLEILTLVNFVTKLVYF